MGKTIRFDSEAVSEFVTASTRRDAERVAKLALIRRGRAPGHVIHVEEYGDGSFEVVYSERPLRPGEGFLPSGQRYGNAGTRADWR